MAGTAPWTDKLWGFPVSVFFIFCRKSVFHRSGAACGAAASDESGGDSFDFGKNPNPLIMQKLYQNRYKICVWPVIVSKATVR